MSHPQKLKDDVRLEDQRHAVVGRNFESVTLSTIRFIANKKNQKKKNVKMLTRRKLPASLRSLKHLFLLSIQISPRG